MLSIILAGIIARALYVLQLHQSIFYHRYVLDSLVIDLWAKDIASGNVLGNLTFFRAPLYPYVVALIYSLFGTAPLATILFQNLLGLATVYLVFVYARYLFGWRTGVLAAAITACYPTLIFFEGELMITSMEVFLAVLSLMTLHRALQIRNARAFLIAGVILGLAAITRPTFLVIVFLYPIFLISSRARVRLQVAARDLMILVLGLLIPILPVTARNAFVSQDFVLISSQGGSNFYVGNSSRADGITVRALGPMTRLGPYQDNIWSSSVEVAEQQSGRKLRESEVSSFWMDAALREMASDPGRAVGLMLRKFYFFWHGQEIINDKSIYLAREYSSLMSVILWTWFLKFPSGLLFPLMIVGIVASVRRSSPTIVPLLYLLLYSAGIALFFVCARFRQPIVPIAILFAAVGIMQIVKAIRRGKRWRKVSPLLPLAVCTIILNLGGNVDSAINRSQYEWMLGDRYLNDKEYDSAITHLSKALAISPDHLGVLNQLGVAYTAIGKLDEAEAALKHGLALYGSYAAFSYNLGIVHSKREKIAEAKASFLKAIADDPQFGQAYLRLGEIYEYEGFPDSARSTYQTLIQLHPDDIEAQQHIDQLK